MSAFTPLTKPAWAGGNGGLSREKLVCLAGARLGFDEPVPLHCSRYIASASAQKSACQRRQIVSQADMFL